MWAKTILVLSAAATAAIGQARAQQAQSGYGSVAPEFSMTSPAPFAWRRLEDFNWSDSPILLNAHQSLSYNSNVINLPSSFGNLTSLKDGDYLSTTIVGASSKLNAGAQQFFTDATYTVINYRKYHSIDQHNYYLDGGVNWNLGSRCNGNIIGVVSTAQATAQETFGPGVNTIHAASINENAQCGVYQNVSVTLNSGYNTRQNSQLVAQAINNATAFILGGLQYQWEKTDRVQAQVKYSNTTFTNTNALNVIEQAIGETPQGNVRLTNYQIVYDRIFSDKFDVSALGGLAVADVPGANGRNSTSPIYTFSANWRPSPLWVINVSVSRTVTPPVSALSYTQVGNAESFGVTYIITPKVTLNAAIGRSQLLGASVAALANNPNASLLAFGSNTLISSSFKANYQWTPFTSAYLSVSTSQRSGNSGNIPQNIFMLGLDYRPK